MMDISEMKAAGLDVEAVRRGWDLMGKLQEPGREGRETRILFMRALAELARENAAARSIVVKLLDTVAGKLPVEAETFRSYYLEGEKRPSARQLARRLRIDQATVYRHNKTVLKAMLAPAFGVCGCFMTDSERERAQGGPGGRQEPPPEAGEGKYTAPATPQQEPGQRQGKLTQ